MLTLVMPYMLVKDVPLELVAEVNKAAKLAGKNQSEWVRWVLEAQFNGFGNASGVAERVERPAQYAVGHAEIPDLEAEQMAEDEANEGPVVRTIRNKLLPEEDQDGTGLRRAVDERVVGSSLADCAEPLAPAECDEVAEDEKRCPECGEALVWNKVMKHCECVCGWHGKKEGNG